MSSPFSADLYDSRNLNDMDVWMMIFNGLLLVNPYQETEIIPDLAESWTVSDDGLKLTFKLRRGVQWHDGKPLTAGDVTYSYNRAINPPSAFIVRNSALFSPISKVETSDDSTVVLNMKRPSASFLRGIASSTVSIMPAHLSDMQEYAKQPIGTGAFRFAKAQANLEIEVSRNTNYWKKDGRGQPLPYLDGVKVPIIADPALQTAAFRAGRIDIATPYPGIDRNYLFREFNKEVPGSFAAWCWGTRGDTLFNQVPPFTDIRVRKAIHLAYDRHEAAAIRDKTEGVASPFAGLLLPPDLGGLWGIPDAELQTMPGFRKDKTADLAEARRLLQEAGLEKLAWRHSVGTGSGERFGSIFADSLKRGLSADVRLQVFGGGSSTITQALTRGDFESTRANFGLTFDDPGSNLVTEVTSKGPSNYGKWSDPEIDRLADLQEATLDVAKRRQLILDLQRRALEVLFIVPMDWALQAYGWYPYVKNQPEWRLSQGTQWRFEQTWLSK